MKFYELDLNGQTIKLRLKSADSVVIEKKTGVKLLDFIQDYSITAVITMLTYLRRSDVPNFSEKDAYDLYDELVDSGYTLEKIMYDVIFEALVVSGFLAKEQLEEMKVAKEEAKEKKKQEMLKDLQK